MQVSVDSESMSRRTETAYKAQSPDKSAQHDEAQEALGSPWQQQGVIYFFYS